MSLPSLNFKDIYDRIIEYIKNPIVCGLIIGGLTYIIYSYNYITKRNFKEKYQVKSQRINNLKSAVYVAIIATILVFIFKYINCEMPESTTSIKGGEPPF